MKRTVVFLLALLMMSSLVMAEEEGPVGIWKMESAIQEGWKIQPGEMGNPVLVLHEDGTATMNQRGLNLPMAWSMDDGTITLPDGKSYSFGFSPYDLSIVKDSRNNWNYVRAGEESLSEFSNPVGDWMMVNGTVDGKVLGEDGAQQYMSRHYYGYLGITFLEDGTAYTLTSLSPGNTANWVGKEDGRILYMMPGQSEAEAHIFQLSVENGHFILTWNRNEGEQLVFALSAPKTGEVLYTYPD